MQFVRIVFAALVFCSIGVGARCEEYEAQTAQTVRENARGCPVPVMRGEAEMLKAPGLAAVALVMRNYAPEDARGDDLYRELCHIAWTPNLFSATLKLENRLGEPYAGYSQEEFERGQEVLDCIVDKGEQCEFLTIRLSRLHKKYDSVCTTSVLTDVERINNRIGRYDRKAVWLNGGKCALVFWTETTTSKLFKPFDWRTVDIKHLHKNIKVQVASR